MGIMRAAEECFGKAGGDPSFPGPTWRYSVLYTRPYEKIHILLYIPAIFAVHGKVMSISEGLTKVGKYSGIWCPRSRKQAGVKDGC